MTKNKAIPIFFLTAGFLWVGIAQAQENANTSGGVATGSGGTVAYSIGQVAYTTNTGSNGSVDQGVQHAYEIFTVGIKETELNISLTAFPNPTKWMVYPCLSKKEILDFFEEEMKILINEG
jgi:hypothetical protein